MADLLPYGANILLSSIESTIPSNIIPLGRSDFITSMVNSVTTKYTYSEYNGTLVGISTNLNYELDTQEKTLVLSNSNIFNTNDKPYIKLLFNKVKIPISFINDNKWSRTIFNDNNTLTLRASNATDAYAPYVIVPKEYVISWSTTEENSVFIEKNTSTAYAEYYTATVFYNYLDENNNIISGSTNILNNATFSNKKIVIPKLNGELGQIKYGTDNKGNKRKFINYFALGISVRIWNGATVSKAHTLNYINGINKVYDNRGRVLNISGKYYLDNNKGIPTMTTALNVKWNTDFFYTTQQNQYYISPSSSEIFYELDINAFCNSDCPNQCFSYCDECSSEGGGCPSEGGGCPSDGGGDSKPWETEKEWCGGTGTTHSAIWQYDEPNGNHSGSIEAEKTFAVYYYWEGWYQIAGNKWIRADADWDYDYGY